MKVVVTSTSGSAEGDPPQFVKILRETHPEVEFAVAVTNDDQKREVRDADIFYGWPEREVFLAAERLRWIHCPGTGVDRLTAVPELIESDVVLTNARGPHAPPMADHVLGMIIVLAHKMHLMRDDQKSHVWDMGKWVGKQAELAGSTMGILALGDIGTETAKRAHGFGMDIYAADLRPVPKPPFVKEIWGLERLDDLLRMSDWFVVTAPLTQESRGMIDRRRIGLLKDGAHVILISRGAVVDEVALTDELVSGRLGGAGIDAFDEEPLADGSPLWDLDNVIVTPHSSAHTPDMTEGRRRIFAENLRRFLANEPFIYTVDKKAGF